MKVIKLLPSISLPLNPYPIMLHSLIPFLLLSITVLSSTINKISNSRIVICDESISMGKCTSDNRCEEVGYMCDSENILCCPVVDYTQQQWIMGPAINGKCEVGTAIVKIPGGEEGGECVSVYSIPGICPYNLDNISCEHGMCWPGETCFEAANLCCKDV